MPNFFKSFFSGKSETPESEKQKNDQKNFEIFKYDGLRAQRMGRPDYAIKCFTEALAIEEDFETMGYLSQLYIPMGETEKARELLEKMAVMEPHVTSTFLTLANVCYIQEDYKAMEEAAGKAIAIRGEVQYPGVYQYADNETLEELQVLALMVDVANHALQTTEQHRLAHLSR